MAFEIVLGIVSDVALIQSDLGPSGNNLEVIANVKSLLKQFLRELGDKCEGPQAIP